MCKLLPDVAVNPVVSRLKNQDDPDESFNSVFSSNSNSSSSFSVSGKESTGSSLTF